MKDTSKRQKRPTTFVPKIEVISLSDWRLIKQTFASKYPLINRYKNNDDCLWEYLHCAFFAVLASGLLGTNSPITLLYDINRISFNAEEGSLRIKRMQRGNDSASSNGRRIYLPILAKMHLLSFLIHLDPNTHQAWKKDREGKLVPSELFPRDDFRKRFQVWFSDLCDNSGINKELSFATIKELIRIDLLSCYPTFIAAAISGQVRYSPMPDITSKMVRAVSAKLADRIGLSDACAFDISDIINYPLIEELDHRYSMIYESLNTISKKSSRSDRKSVSERIQAISNDSVKRKAPDIDYKNFVCASSWLQEMLSLKLAADTVKTYFHQVSAVLRTELQGEDLNGLSHSDVEIILEGCTSGNSARVLKASLKSFLKHVVKHPYNIILGDILWRHITTINTTKDTPILWPSDVTEILKLTEDRQIRLAIMLAFKCGMRIGEIICLERRDIHLMGEAYLDIKYSKSASGKRRLPLYRLLTKAELQELSDLLDSAAQCDDQDGKDQYYSIFKTKAGSSFDNPQVLAIAVKRIMDKARFNWATFHTLRHSFASLMVLRWFHATQDSKLIEGKWQELRTYDVQLDRILLQNDLADIAKLLGHADVRTTVTNYIHTLDLLQKAYLDRYERDNQPELSHGQAIDLAKYSKTSVYNHFPPNMKIDVARMIKLQIKRLKQL